MTPNHTDQTNLICLAFVSSLATLLYRNKKLPRLLQMRTDLYIDDTALYRIVLIVTSAVVISE